MKTVIFSFLFIASSVYWHELNAQANPVSNNTEEIQQYNLFMDPVFGYGETENLTNFNSRNYWFRAAEVAPQDEHAWFNYYRATRYIAEGSAGFEVLQSELDSIEQHMVRNVIGTWEQLIIEYWNSGRDIAKNGALESAFKLRPTDPLTLRFMIGKEFLTGNLSSAFQYYADWKGTGDAPLSTETYAYNVVQSLPKGAVLFTNGEMDTYPLIYQLQESGNATVQLISIAFCSRGENRKALFEHAGIVLPDNDMSTAIDGNFIARVADANPNKKIYVASTCGGDLLRQIMPNLYCTGLAFRYSAIPLDHLNFLRDNVGTKMKLDGVGKAVKGKNHFDLNYASKLDMNYYLPLLITADSYASAGNANRAKELRLKAKKIRQRAGYEEELRNEGLDD